MISPARRAAFEVLAKVYGGQHADVLLHCALLKKLSQRDAALATTLVMGVLRWQLLLDSVLRGRLRNPAQTAEPVWIALRLGLFQLWFLDRVPPHAALSESVELVRAFGAPHSAGAVNAILRRLQGGGKPAEAEANAQAPWMLSRWTEHYGETAAIQIAAGSQREPRKMARVVDGATADAMRGDGAAFLTRAVVADGEEDGVRLQDEGSQLVAEIAAFAGHGAVRVLDACAAPGGKTAILAERLPDAEIVAVDLSAKRLREMETLLPQAVRDRVELVQADAAELPSTGIFARPFDLVLCDAPCSGTGTLARNPEIRLRLQKDELLRQRARQVALLKGLWPRAAERGALVYSTCSLEPEENATVIAQFAASEPGAAIEHIAPILSRMEDAGILRSGAASTLAKTGVRDKALQTLPGVHPCDGFFCAVLRRD